MASDSRLSTCHRFMKRKSILASGMLIPRKTAGVQYRSPPDPLWTSTSFRFRQTDGSLHRDRVDRVQLELFARMRTGCRFCQAGIVYRPQRERNPFKCLLQRWNPSRTAATRTSASIR